MERREFLLRDALDKVKDRYDFLFIDCPPSLELLTLNALCAADAILVPVQGEYYALEGLSDLMNTVRIVRRSLNPRLELDGVLLTMFDGRTNLALQVAEEVKHYFPGKVYATVIPLLQHRWLAANTSGVMHYLPAAYCVVALVIVTLVLLCVSPLVQRLARWAMGFLPKTEPWQTRREKWLEQLNTLATESRLLLADKGRCARILAVQTLKLFLMFTLPWFCIRFMGLSCGLSFWQVQLLTSLMLFLSNALPNVAGMGSIETAFLLVFSSFMTSGEAMSTLMLFRIASYYFVFAASAAGTFAAQKHLENS